MQLDKLDAFRLSIRWSPYVWAGTFAVLALIYVVARAGSWLAMAVTAWPLYRYRGDQWSERARRAWPSRRMGYLALMSLGVASLPVFANTSHRLLLLPRSLLMSVAGTTAIWAVLETMIRRERRLNPAYALTPRAERTVRISWMLIGVPIVLGVVILDTILPARLDLTAWVILIAVAVALSVYLLYVRLALLRIAGVIRPARERLRVIVERIVGETGIAPPKVIELGLPMANAFAFPIHRMLGMTDACLAIMNDDEISVICAHEMAHLAEPRAVRWARAARVYWIGVCAAVVTASARPLPAMFGPPATFLGIMAAAWLFLLGVFFSNRLTLKMERRADNQAAAMEASPGVYARALEKLYETNLVPAVLRSKRLTHPHLYDRMLAAGIEPAYPRPKPPPRWAGLLGLAALVVVIGSGVTGYWLITKTLPDAMLDRKPAILWRIGCGVSDSREMAELLFGVPRVQRTQEAAASRRPRNASRRPRRAVAGSPEFNRAGSSRETEPADGSPTRTG